jgi:ribosomal protein S27E
MSQFTEIRCTKCNNDFAYTQEQVIVEDDYKYVICPICGEKNLCQ